jgi:hypothetical protein
MSFPSFSVGEVLTAADMNAVGLWKITSGTSSGTTAYNYDGVFTSSYRNYRIVLSNIEVSIAGRALRLNYRTAGSTNSTSNYNYAYRGLRATGGSGDTSSGGAVAFAEIGVYIDAANADVGDASIDIYSPQMSKRTGATVNAYGYEAATFQYRQGGFEFNATTVFDGFRLSLSDTGNLAYDYAIYGYKN